MSEGQMGGAEIFTAKLASRMRDCGVDARLVFIKVPGAIRATLHDMGVPYVALGFKCGRSVVNHCREYAQRVERSGPDGALIVERGFMTAALRAGGYRQPIIAVEHGPLLLERSAGGLRPMRRLNRACGAFAASAEVGVSDFMVRTMREYTHARILRRIYNGVDLPGLPPVAGTLRESEREVTVGVAGRLIPGKGVDSLIRAVARVVPQIPVRLLIAGDGPERPRLEIVARQEGLAARAKFVGVVTDLAAFWNRCMIAVTPSDTFVESFSMTTLEAMACGKAVVATRNGAIPELVQDGVTGTLVPCGDVTAIATALAVYAKDGARRNTHGQAAVARATTTFHIRASTNAYLDLFAELQHVARR